MELGGIHQVAGCYIGAQTRDPEDDCGYNDDDDIYIMMMRPSLMSINNNLWLITKSAPPAKPSDTSVTS